MCTWGLGVSEGQQLEWDPQVLVPVGHCWSVCWCHVSASVTSEHQAGLAKE